MNFYTWFLQLAHDCARRGISRRLRTDTIGVWARIFAAGVSPSVAAVCEWCLMDPDRFEDLRESEVSFEWPMAA
jgi:hypothetical protein